jgi:hypothetical protein
VWVEGAQLHSPAAPPPVQPVALEGSAQP